MIQFVFNKKLNISVVMNCNAACFNLLPENQFVIALNQIKSKLCIWRERRTACASFVNPDLALRMIIPKLCINIDREFNLNHV